MTIRDLQVAPDNPLSQDVGTVVRRITGRGGFRGREDIAVVHLETGGSCEAVVEFTAPLAFPPQHNRVRTHGVSGSIEQVQQAQPFFLDITEDHRFPK